MKKNPSTENNGHRRRSASRGKGLSLIQMNSMLINNENCPNMLLKNNQSKKIRAFRTIDIY